MKRTALLISALFLAATAAIQAADPVVDNVVSSQRAGTKLVDITFEVSDVDSNQLTMSIEVSDDAGTSFLVPATALSGDTTINATPALTGYALVWDAAVDFNQQINSNMVVRVIADDGSSLGPPPAGMVLVPAGSFERGQPGSGSASPVQTVTLAAFYIDQFEVTKALWDDVAAWGAANGYTDLPAGGGEGPFYPVHTLDQYAMLKWCNARSEQEGLVPAYYTTSARTTVYRKTNIALEDDYVDWSANGFRLPTEAEWEKAARGMLVQKAYPWGDTIGGGDANYSASGDPFGTSSPVGYYDGDQTPSGPNRANGYGLYDVAGNVYELCWDWYDSNYYASAVLRDPHGPLFAQSVRTLRGGSLSSSAFSLKCALRQSFSGFLIGNYVGFRTARTK